MKILYIIYQICIGLPIFLVLTILTALTTMIGCWLGNGHFWGYYPGKIWSQLTCWLFLLPVSVEGHEKIDHRTSYVFLANHQGAFDIFLIYGFLGRNFKWMMKKVSAKFPSSERHANRQASSLSINPAPEKFMKPSSMRKKCCREELRLLSSPKDGAPLPAI